MIDFLHEKYDDLDDDKNIPKVEGQYRKILRLTIGALKSSPIQGTYWFTDDSLGKLLKYSLDSLAHDSSLDYILIPKGDKCIEQEAIELSVTKALWQKNLCPLVEKR